MPKAVDITEQRFNRCCKVCNIMKKAMDLGEFLGHVNRIMRHVTM